MGWSPERQRTLALSIGGAVGGAVLLFLGQVATEEYKSYRQGIAQQIAAGVAREQEQTQLLDELITKFDGIAPVAERAGKFIDTGKGGSKNDVGQVAGHFRVLIRYIVNGRINATRAASYYGGPVPYWSKRFGSLADGTSPAANHFADNERASFSLLANALSSIGQLMVATDENDPLQQLTNEQRPARYSSRRR